VFYIVSELNSKVLDIRGGSSSPGTQVIMWPRKHDRSPNQLWYNDEQGCIRSSLNDYALEARSQGDGAVMQPFRNDPRQQWMFQGNRIVNRYNQNEVLDIERADSKDGARIISWGTNNGRNQQWRMEYA